MTAAIRTQAWSVARARKIWVSMLLPLFSGDHARIGRGAEIRN
jgi:hypothetical protein